MSKTGASVKGVIFVDLIDAGDPGGGAARAYDRRARTSCVFSDINATAWRTAAPMYDVVTRTAEACFIADPWGVGWRTSDECAGLVAGGADKVSFSIRRAVGGPSVVAQEQRRSSGRSALWWRLTPKTVSPANGRIVFTQWRPQNATGIRRVEFALEVERQARGDPADLHGQGRDQAGV